MVQLNTQPPEVQPSQVDTRLGVFQQAGGSVFGALAEGVGAGIGTLERGLRAQPESDEIDQDLFDALIGVNPSEFEQLERGLGREVARERQTGRSRVSRMLAATRQARAAGLSPDVVERTFRAATGSSVFQVERLLEEETGTEVNQRDLVISQLQKEQNLFTDDGVPVADLTDEELFQFAFERERERERLQGAEERFKLLSANEDTNVLNLKNQYRTEVLPAKIRALDTRLNTFLNENKAWFPVERVQIAPGIFEARLRVDELPVEDVIDEQTGEVLVPGLNTMKDTIREFRTEFQQSVNEDFLFRLTSEERNQLLQQANNYLDEALDFLNGNSTLEALKAQAELSQAQATDQFYRDNPDARHAVVVASELGDIMEKLGLEGLQLRQDLAENVFLPMTKGVNMNALIHLRSQGMSDEEAAEAYREMSDYIANPGNNLEIRGSALRNLLENMSNGAVDDSTVYRSMMDMLGTEAGAETVLDSMTGVQNRRTRQQLQEGFVNFINDYEQSFEEELARTLQRPAFFSPESEEEAQTREQQFARFGSPTGIQRLTYVPRRLGEFVTENLFSEDSEALNTEALAELPAADRNKVINAYRQLRLEFDEELIKIARARENLFTAQQRAQLMRTPEAPEEPSEAE